MNKLLKSEFIRLFKSNIFIFCLLFSAGLGIFMALLNLSTIDELIFSGFFDITFVIAVFVSIFVGTDYSNGTIRNKIIVGHTRWNIYFSKLIVCAASDIIFHLVYILAVLISGGLIIGGLTLSAEKIVFFTLVSSSSILALTALLLFLSMTFQSKTAGAVICILTILIMFYASINIEEQLSEPEYYITYTSYDEDTDEITEIGEDKNPRYISGKIRKLYEFLYNFMPVSQLYQLSEDDTKHSEDDTDISGYNTNISEHKTNNFKIIVMYDIILIIAATGTGMVIFKLRNLN